MKATIEVKGKSIEIDLTKEQIQFIENATADFININSLEAALNYNSETLDQFNHRTQFDTDQQKAGKEIEVIAEAVRQGKPLGDKWYYPWFHAARSASGFSFLDCYCGHVRSGVGARHCVNSEEEATYMGNQFLSIYNRYING